MNIYKDKRILVIGGTGTIGSKLIKELLQSDVKVVRVYSRDEYKQFIMSNEFMDEKRIRFLIGDVRDKERLNRAMKDIDIVFNLAAMKHVPASEYNPFEAVKTNVIGTQNVIECALDNNVERIVYTSSDKAVSPTNTMGATKLLAERMIASADNYKGKDDMIFCAVRFGNVMGSRGSVLPLWKKQILSKREITITEPEMTRFMMTQLQAVQLTMRACEKAAGGEIFVLKMPVLKLGDLAEIFMEEICKKNNINKNDVKIKCIGLRPGEKMYEELMSEKEATEAIEFDDMFAIIPPHKDDILKVQDNKRPNKQSYSSNGYPCMNREEIRQYILENDLV